MLLDRADDAAPAATDPGLAATDPAATDPGLAVLRLVCVVRAGDGYLVRAVAEPARPGQVRRHVDITFGDAADRVRSGELEAVVRRIQHWCDDGTPVDLVDTGSRLALRSRDGAEVVLPRA